MKMKLNRIYTNPDPWRGAWREVLSIPSHAYECPGRTIILSLHTLMHTPLHIFGSEPEDVCPRITSNCTSPSVP
jgi:hypothetical protein